VTTTKRLLPSLALAAVACASFLGGAPIARAHSQFSDWVAICQWSGSSHTNYHYSGIGLTDAWGCSGTARSARVYTQFIGSSGTFLVCSSGWNSAPPASCYTVENRTEEVYSEHEAWAQYPFPFGTYSTVRSTDAYD